MSRNDRLSELLAPAPLLAAGVLGVNDHWLKPLLHNAATGKLSDLAGCFLFPLYVAALLAWLTGWSRRSRIHVGALATLALFVPIKLFPPAADAVAHLLTALGRPLGWGPMHIIADPSDLIALPMVHLAWAYSLRRRPSESSPAVPFQPGVSS